MIIGCLYYGFFKIYSYQSYFTNNFVIFENRKHLKIHIKFQLFWMVRYVHHSNILLSSIPPPLSHLHPLKAPPNQVLTPANFGASKASRTYLLHLPPPPPPSLLLHKPHSSKASCTDNFLVSYISPRHSAPMSSLSHVSLCHQRRHHRSRLLTTSGLTP